MDEQHEILRKIADFVRSKYPGADVYLFGSRARGEARKVSDWDLLILLNKKQVSFEEETQIMDDLYELELETGEVISPLIYAKTDWELNHRMTPLYNNISKEGLKI